MTGRHRATTATYNDSLLPMRTRCIWSATHRTTPIISTASLLVWAKLCAI
jgi:hypothetical protein